MTYAMAMESYTADNFVRRVKLVVNGEVVSDYNLEHLLDKRAIEGPGAVWSIIEGTLAWLVRALPRRPWPRPSVADVNHMLNTAAGIQGDTE